MTYALKAENNPLADKIAAEAILEQLPVYPRKGEWALFLDIDGTISDIAPTPEKAFIPAKLLAALHQKSKGALALISGRSLASIDKLTYPHLFAAAGQHGLEIRHHTGQSAISGKIADSSLAEITKAVERLVASHPGLRMEHKGVSIAVHFRNIPEMEIPVMACLSQLAEHYNDFCVQHGKMVGEIRPRGADKGTAITSFMQSAPFRGKTPVFAGDDETDEAGFRAVNALSGISIKVGGEPSLASYRAETPGAVRNWLHDVLPFLVSETGNI